MALCHHVVYSHFVDCPLRNIKFDWHLVPAGSFFFSLLMMSGTHTKKNTADEMPAEGNCQRFLQGASVWAALGAPFTRFIGLQWKLRRADLDLFRICPHSRPPCWRFSKFIFVADKWSFKISYSIYFYYFYTVSSIYQLTMETKTGRFGTISD